VGDLNIPHHQEIGHPNQKQQQQQILDLNQTIDEIDLANVYRIFHSPSAQYTFFLAAHGIF
jgi:hypothetical protein